MSIRFGVKIPRELSVVSTWYQKTNMGTDGRRSIAYVPRSTGRAAVASIDATERLRWGQLGHPVSHNVVYDHAVPTARPGDYFLINGKRFYVHAIEDPGELGIVTLFKTEERPDKDE